MKGGRDGGDPQWMSGSAFSSRFPTLTQHIIACAVRDVLFRQLQEEQMMKSLQSGENKLFAATSLIEIVNQREVLSRNKASKRIQVRLLKVGFVCSD